MSATISLPPVDTDAAEVARTVEGMVHHWRLPAYRQSDPEVSQLKAECRRKWETHMRSVASWRTEARAVEVASHHYRAMAGALAEIDRIEAVNRQATADRAAADARRIAEEAALQAAADARQAALEALERTPTQIALREAQRQAKRVAEARAEADRIQEAGDEWILDNVPEEFRPPVDMALLHEDANPLAVRHLLRDGVPLDVPDANVDAWKAAHLAGRDYGLNWFVYGPSGCGKTRAAFSLTMEHARTMNTSIRFWSFKRWARAYQFAQQSEEGLDEYTQIVDGVDWLVVDEFRPSMTEPQAEGFLELLKARFDQHLRLIVTSMFTLEKCFTLWAAKPELEEWGLAFRRRIEHDQKMTPFYLGKM